jgi:E3 ubiquitin-protein ligase NRDP1
MGFDEKRFVNEIEDEFKCGICEEVMENPIMTTKCEHIFCNQCINQWLQSNNSCPIDRFGLNSSKLRQPNRTYKLFYSRLEIKCEFESNGCQVICKIEDLESHEKTCTFNPDMKIFCDKECGAFITKDELKNHNCIQYLKDINIAKDKELNETKRKLNECQQDLSLSK